MLVRDQQDLRVFQAKDMKKRGKTIKTGFGKDYDKEYDEAGFCKVLAAAIDSGCDDIDLFYAAKLAKKEPR